MLAHVNVETQNFTPSFGEALPPALTSLVQRVSCSVNYQCRTLFYPTTHLITHISQLVIYAYAKLL